MSGRTRLTVMAGLASLLGSAVLRPLFASADYLLPIAGAVLVVCLAAEAVRRLALPTVLAPVAALLALTGYLVAVFAHEQAVLGVLPGAEARTALRALVDAGRDDIARLAPPVPLHNGVLLLTTAGAGLVAVLVDLIAVSLRRAAAAGLPLFALFVVPAAIAPRGIGAIPFVVAASGYLALLIADGRERLGRWGRPLGAGRHPDEGPALRAEVAETSPLARVGRRIAAASLGLAIVVPGLIPGVDDKPLGGRSNGSGSGGSHSVTAINPITSLKRQLTAADDTPILRYTRDADAGYLRLTTLDIFDGQQWSQSILSVGEDHRVELGIPDPLGLAAAVPRHYAQVQIQVRDSFREPWLPLPYPATEVYVDGDWRYDDDTRTVFSSRTSTQGLGYRAKAAIPEPTAELLRAAGAPTVDGRYLRLPTKGPNAVPPEVIALAHEVVGDATSDFDKAVALQRFFHEQFKYDLTVADGNGTDALKRFLLRDRRGYCEQFASAMAALARALGIPARVNIGFTPGIRNGDGFLVTVHDAHAWPELWFNGVGWLPFEPTPRGDGQVRQPSYSLPPAPTAGQPSAKPTATAQPSAAPTQKAQSRLEEDQATAARKRAARQRTPWWALALVALGAAAVLAAVPATVRVVTRRRRWARAETAAAGAHAAWAELRDTVRDLGLGWDRTQTPRAAARQLGAGLADDPAAALRRIGAAEERARYARSLESPQVDPLRADSALVSAALRSAASRRRRVRAVLLPQSVLAAALHAVTGLVADALDGVDAVFAALGRLGRRALHPLRSSPAGRG